MQKTSPLAIALVLIVSLVVVGVAGGQNSLRGDITVVIANIRNAEGNILISLYDEAEGFPKDRSAIIRAAAVPAEPSGQITTVFGDLPYGDYAIAVLHDEDESQGMTFGAFRLPKEGYCFSNNVKVRFKPPKFKKAKFSLDGDNVLQTLRMRY